MYKFNYSEIANTNSILRYQRKFQHFCFFCGTDVQSKFKQAPHLTPELLGRNSNTYNYECDDCNEFFSGAYENDLANFVRPSLLTSATRTKKGFPKYKDKKTNSSISFVDGKFHVMQFTNESNLVEFDHVDKKGKIMIPRDPFNPFKVYKALVKIGVSMLPPDKQYLHKDTISSLMDPQSTNILITPICISFGFGIEGKKFQQPSAELYEANSILIDDNELIHHIIVLEFGNFVIQTFLPLSSENQRLHNPDHKLRFDIDYVASKYIHYKNDDIMESAKMSLRYFDLSINEKVDNDIETYGMTYETFV